MRLITLYKNLREGSSLTTSQFEVRLESDLELPAKSSMALINANLKYNDDFIVITPLNNEFNLFVTQAQRDADAPFRVTLDTGTFNKTTLLENLQAALNSSIEFTGNLFTSAGMSTNVFYDKENKINIQFGKSALQDFDPVLNDAAGYDELEKVGGPPFGLERKTGAGTNNFNGFALLDAVPINKGASQASFTTTTDITAGQRFVIGLLTDKVDYSVVTQLPPSSYAVSLSSNANPTYEVNSVDTGVAVGTNDNVKMIISEGTVIFTKNDVPIGDPVPYRENLGKTDNYMYMSLFGADARMNYVKYHEDPFFGQPPPTDNLRANPNSIITIDFAGVAPESDLGELLGFDSEVIVLQGNQSTFTATNALNFEIAEDAGVNLLIDNIPLRSYNFTGGVERSQPILHCIPEGLRDSIGVVSYIPPYMVSVDINNQFPINLKDLRVSVRNIKDNSLIALDEISLSIAIN